jgi:2-succinyl-6-hydroxy-2,4-cyclohexadiene-1-carboxylate synthase
MTLVFLHGFVGAASDFDSVIAHLPTGTATRSLALPGHAPSQRVDPDLDFEAVADRLLDHLHDEKIHLVGYSLGARLALAMCVRHPSRVRRATLIGVNPGLESESERRERLASDEAWAALLETRGLAVFLDEWYRQPVLRIDGARPSRAEHDVHELARALRQLGLARMPSYWQELSALALPIQLVVGALDEKFSSIAERMSLALPNARLTRVPAAGHNVVLDEPRALAASLMLDTSP